jgi:hypothetical protein
MTQTHLQHERPTEPLVARGNGANQPTTPHKKPEKIKRLRYLLSRTALRVPLYWARHLNLRSTDIFLGSYPRSGSTWSRFVLYELLTGREAGFDAVNTTLRGVQRMAHGIPVLPNSGRLVGSHEQYSRKYRRAMYLVRDCRDVVLSEYAYLKSLGFFREDFDQFIAAFVGTQGRINGFGPWQEHVTSWLNSPIAGTSDFLLVQFEDLRRNPEDSFERICDFLGVRVKREAIQTALANNSLARMREKELRSPQLPTGKESFVRTGSVQGWRGKLTQSQLDLIERHAGSVLASLGYATGTVSQETASGDVADQAPLGKHLR